MLLQPLRKRNQEGSGCKNSSSVKFHSAAIVASTSPLFCSTSTCLLLILCSPSTPDLLFHEGCSPNSLSRFSPGLCHLSCLCPFVLESLLLAILACLFLCDHGQRFPNHSLHPNPELELPIEHACGCGAWVQPRPHWPLPWGRSPGVWLLPILHPICSGVGIESGLLGCLLTPPAGPDATSLWL